jgi:hypothetical protein
MVDNTIALRGESLQAPNLLGMANTAAQTRNTLAQTDIDQSQEQRAQYTGEVQKSRDALAYVNSPEQYLAWHEANHSNPVLGPMLSKMGVTAEQSRAKIMDELQKPGGLERLIQQSAAGADKISGIMQGRLNQMTSDRATAAANARKAQEMAQIYGARGEATPAPASANALAPVATAMPVAPPRNTLAAPAGSPTAIENLYAPALANANVAAATPFSPSQGVGAVPPVVDRTSPTAQFEAENARLLSELPYLESLAARGNLSAKKLAEDTVKKIKFNQDQIKFNRPETEKYETEFSKQIGKAKAEEYQKLQTTATNAAQNLPKIYDTLNQIKSSDAITGFGADILKNIERARAQISADKKAGKRVADTEILDAMLGSEVFPMIGALGIGAKGLDTPAEREFLRQVMTGTINMNKDALIRLTEIRKNVAEKAVERYNKAVDKGELNKFFEVQGIAPQKIELPSQQQSGSGAGGANIDALLEKYK